MPKRNTFVAAGVGLVLVAGVGGTALAANNSVAPSNAGQGTGEVAGFTITNVEYVSGAVFTTTAEPVVSTVTFDIVRDAPSAEVVNSNNARIYVQLRDDEGADTSWEFCGSGLGKATCVLDTPAATMALAAVDDVSVVAHDLTVLG